MKCPRCNNEVIELSTVNKVCVRCVDEEIFEKDPQRLAGRGYDLRPLRRLAGQVGG